MRIIVGRSLCVMISSLLPLLLLESGLRIAYPGPFTALMKDQELGQILRPNLDGRKTYGGHERVVRIRTNSIGLRSGEIPTTKLPRVRRLVALGDSMTFGDAVEQEEAWPYKLEKRLNEGQRSYQFEVINAGVSGYGTGQQLLFYRKLNEQLKPDLVVVGFSVVNDLLNNLCVAEGSYRPRADAPCFKDREDDLTIRWPQFSDNHGDRILKRWIRRSRAAALFKGQAKRLVVWNPRILYLLQRAGISIELPYLPGTIASWYDIRFSKPGWALTRRLLLELRDLLDATGVPLVVLIIPSSLQVERGKQEVLALLGHGQEIVQEYLQDQTRPQRLFLEFCADERLTCVDPLSALLQAEKQGERPYYPIDQHLTPAGHYIAADLLARQLRNGFVR